METILKKVLARFWPSGALFLGGFFLILYVALGILFLQQGAQQKELSKEIIRLNAVLAKPLPSEEELRADYEEANRALAPVTDQAIVGIIVGIAERSGIDISPAAGKLRIPYISAGKRSRVQVGRSTYQVLSIDGIYVEGDHDSVMAFLSDLDSGKTLKTMVLKKVGASGEEVMFTDEEGYRRAEFREVITAVIEMMDDNALSEIPNPMDFAGGVATNLMGDDPDTEEVVEGFPDITTTAIVKLYTGTGSPRDGYVLRRHDKISTDDTTQFETVNYITVLTTKYYYTCEADGTVRQFDGADVFTATEYLGSAESNIQTIATVGVDIYTKPEDEE